jgi:hypothetical protein
VAAIERLRELALNALHTVAQVACRRLDDQVEVVPHQAVREARPRHPRRKARQQCEVPPAIQIVDEERLAGRAAREHMVDAVRVK